jgi:Tfp pilus assembly protein PilP
MRLTTAILSLGLAAGTAWAQNPDAIQSTRDTMRALQLKQQVESNRALSSDSQLSNQAGSTAAKSAAASARAQRVVAKQDPLKPKAAKRKKEVVAVERNDNLKAESPVQKSARITGRRDPFVSPVVSQAMVASGCSTGKRCLAVDQIALKGVVKSDSGMIAVVVNSVEKAYFLRENDPVFNGYVVRITGDSIIFKETVHDRLGKPFEREVTKKITTPAV